MVHVALLIQARSRDHNFKPDRAIGLESIVPREPSGSPRFNEDRNLSHPMRILRRIRIRRIFDVRFNVLMSNNLLIIVAVKLLQRTTPKQR
jgi:hypothetical protein